ncbi:MAG: hypothetical protein ACREEM_07885 [Blastocatellia bacterium]
MPIAPDTRFNHNEFAASSRKPAPLTAHGQAVAAAVSPDGKYVVYAKQEPAGQSLWLRQVAVNNSDVVLITGFK